MQRQQLEYITLQMTQDEFYYSFSEQTKNKSERMFLESGRGGHYSIAAWNPVATARSIEEGLHITWQDGTEEVREGEALAQLEQLVNSYQFERISTFT